MAHLGCQPNHLQILCFHFWRQSCYIGLPGSECTRYAWAQVCSIPPASASLESTIGMHHLTQCFSQITFLDCKYTWACEMAQWIKCSVAKPDNLSFIPRINMMERENWLLQVVLTPHVHTNVNILKRTCLPVSVYYAHAVPTETRNGY